MQRNIARFTALLLMTCFLLVGCLDPYTPSESGKNLRYLVIDAFLNATENSCTVTLSRTMPLSGSTITYEEGAEVTLEDSNGFSTALAAGEQGEYVATGLTLDHAKTYKIKISTADGKEYESDLVPVRETPPIDSVSWKEQPTGVGIFVNAHDAANATHYYYWKYTETWMYNSAFESIYMEGPDTVVDRGPGDKVYHCWKTVESSNILVSSSDKLNEDIISQFAIHTIPWKSPRLSMRYSIRVEQRALEREAFEYWQQLKKNTEDLGTIFDPLPFEQFGNLRCLTNPDEIVLGYFSASTVQQQRLFFARSEINFPAGNQIETGYGGCQLSVVLFGEDLKGMIPVILATQSAGPFSVAIGYQVSSLDCVDCRRMGGTNVQPDFWAQ